MRRQRSALTILCTHPSPPRAAPAPAEGPVCAAVADGIRVAEVMTTEVVCVLGDLPLAGLLSLFLSRDVEEMIVVDGDDHLVGVVSRAELARRRDGRVADVMVPARFALQESATLTEATMLIAYQGLAHVPVVSREGRVIGVLAASRVYDLVSGRRTAGATR